MLTPPCGITTYYLYADEGLVAEFDVSGDQQQAYGYVPGSPWGTNPLYTKIGTDYAFYHTDHLGTPQMLTSISGAKVWEGSADAFGQVTVTTETITNNLRFPGQYYDQESGQHYNYFRYYSPVTGRYGKSDPIGLLGGLNCCGYVFSNPIKWVDSSGLEVTITISTFDSTSESIISEYDVTSDLTDETASGFTIENQWAGDNHDKSPIPPGKYKAKLRADYDPPRIELEGVDGYTYIQLHKGNEPKDVKGCFAVGDEWSAENKDWVGGSGDALQEINDVITADGSGKITVIVTGKYEGNPLLELPE